MRWVLWLVVLAGLATADGALATQWFGGRSWIPATLYDGQTSRSVLRATIEVGLPAKPTEFWLDFGTSGVAVLGNQLDASAAAYAAGSQVFDIIRLGGHASTVPFVSDPAAVASGNCSICAGRLGLGASSPVWRLHRTAEIGPHGVVFDPAASIDRPWHACDTTLGEEWLCALPGTVVINGVPYGSRVILSLSTSATYLPLPAYNSYRSAWEFGGMGSWINTGLTVCFDDDCLEVPHDYLLVSRPNQRPVFNIQGHASDDVVIGYEMLRVMRFRRDWNAGQMQVWPRTYERHYSWSTLVLLLATTWVFLRWHFVLRDYRLTPFLIKERRWHVASLISDITFSALLPALLFALPQTWPLFRSWPVVAPVLAALCGLTALANTIILFATLFLFSEKGAEPRGSRLLRLMKKWQVSRAFLADMHGASRDTRVQAARFDVYRTFFHSLGMLLPMFVLTAEVHAEYFDTILSLITASTIVFIFVQTTVSGWWMLWVPPAQGYAGNVALALISGIGAILWPLMFYTTFMPVARALVPDGTMTAFVATLVFIVGLLTLNVHLSRPALVIRLAYIYKQVPFRE